MLTEGDAAVVVRVAIAGICLGLQIAVIEYARNMLGLAGTVCVRTWSRRETEPAHRWALRPRFPQTHTRPRWSRTRRTRS